MAAETLQDAFVDELKNMLNAEIQLVEALPAMAQEAATVGVQKAFNKHLEETREHIERLEQIFEGLQMEPSSRKCTAMEELIKEGENIIRETADPQTREALLIAAAQKVEHYEISAYGTLSAWAQRLGYLEAKELLLDKTLQEEKDTDLRLSELAYAGVNEGAAK
jgi:ferritin-like metal-binding protein YciE